jgi:hypothetical protein
MVLMIVFRRSFALFARGGVEIASAKTSIETGLFHNQAADFNFGRAI